MKAIQTTDRFEIWKTIVTRPEVHGGHPRSMYFAFRANSDENRIVSIAIVAESQFNDVDWVYVQEDCRRNGFATEILRVIEEHSCELKLRGDTSEGKGFREAYEKNFPRLGLINEVFSHVLTRTPRFDIWRARIERTANNHFDLVHVWPSEGDVSQPVCAMVIDRDKLLYVEYLCEDGIDWEVESQTIGAAIESKCGQLDYCYRSAINGIPGRRIG